MLLGLLGGSALPRALEICAGDVWPHPRAMILIRYVRDGWYTREAIAKASQKTCSCTYRTLKGRQTSGCLRAVCEHIIVAVLKSILSRGFSSRSEGRTETVAHSEGRIVQDQARDARAAHAGASIGRERGSCGKERGRCAKAVPTQEHLPFTRTAGSEGPVGSGVEVWRVRDNS
jgi:hypothetical protein